MIVLFLLLGCFLGIITGIIPGLHINNVSLLLLFFLPIADLNIAVLIISMSIMHSFTDFIPSILFGAPEAESFLSILPGHKLLLQGEGLLAIKLTIIGGLIAGIIAVIVSPIFAIFLVQFIPLISLLIPWLLIIVLFSMILSESSKRTKTIALIVVILSGILGIIVLRNYFSVQNPLMPLITGFFGVSAILYSIKEKTAIRKQKIQNNSFQINSSIFSSILAAVSAGIVSLLPSVGASEAAFIVRKIVGKISTKNYLMILGGISTANMIFSVIVLFFIGKTRTGTAAVIKQIIPLSFNELIIIILAIIASLGISAITALFLAKFLVERFHRIKYQKINIAMLMFIVGMTILLSGFKGLIVMSLSTCVGLIAISSHTKRTNCMAFLMIPTIVFYLGI
ncbi:MAG: tripartite tricarboxylate transporter permease [archaeon]|nr:tripartite tricarboxylate transporter permease [archaeon]